jgi:phage major head subunit gpT-like protein
MSVTVTPQLLVSFFQQLDMRYQAGYARRKQYYTEFAEVCPSGTRQNVYSWLAEMPGLRKWVGAKLARNIAARAYALINDDWEDTYSIDRNDVEDDVAGVYGRREELLGDAASRWPDDLVTDALIKGTTQLCFDGQFFFDTDHPVDLDDASQGIYSNLLANTPLNQTNFNAAYAAMQSFRGESGKSLEVTPTLLMVGPKLREIALEITKGGLIAQLAKNNAGSENVGASAPTNINMGDVTPLINPRLIDDTDKAWYLLSTDRIRPIVFQQRKPPTPVQMSDPQNPIVFNQRKWTRGVEARGTAGYSLPFLAIKCTP